MIQGRLPKRSSRSPESRASVLPRTAEARFFTLTPGKMRKRLLQTIRERWAFRSSGVHPIQMSRASVFSAGAEKGEVLDLMAE